MNNCKSYFLKETEKRKDFFWLVNDGKVFLGKRERESKKNVYDYLLFLAKGRPRSLKKINVNEIYFILDCYISTILYYKTKIIRPCTICSLGNFLI